MVIYRTYDNFICKSVFTYITNVENDLVKVALANEIPPH